MIQKWKTWWKEKKKGQKGKSSPDKELDWYQRHPVVSSIWLIFIYFAMDDALLDVQENAKDGMIAFCILLSLFLFYTHYVHGYLSGRPGNGTMDVPKWIRGRKAYVRNLFYAMVLLTIIIPLGYDEFITTWMPNLDSVYYPSQVFLFWLIAPVMEELVFRYLLYDCYTREKYGPVKGALATGILFVICHPVGSMDTMVLYWVPVLALYMIYGSFGLYGSIAAHMIFNFIAI